MTVSVHYQPSTSREPTWEIWRHFPQNMVDVSPGIGYLLHEDFAVFPAGATNTTGGLDRWQVFQSDGASIADAGLANVSGIKLASDGDNEGVIVTSATAPIRITKGSTRKVAFGCRFRTSTIADTKHGFIMGLWEALTPTATSHIAAAGTLADENFIGFHRLEGDGDKLDIVYKADGQTQQSFADALTLEADTWYRAEFYFDGDKTVKFYLDGVPYATAQLGATELDAATFPDDINLTPTFGMLNATASTPGSFLLDWLRFGYTFGDSD